MQITGDQLLFLVQVLKDSLNIEMGYGWVFEQSRNKRKIFYDEFMKNLISQQDINIQEMDHSKFRNME